MKTLLLSVLFTVLAQSQAPFAHPVANEESPSECIDLALTESHLAVLVDVGESSNPQRKVELHTRVAGEWSLLGEIELALEVSSEAVGRSVDLDQSSLVVGGMDPNGGWVAVFDSNSGGLEVSRPTLLRQKNRSRFGHAVDLDGDRLAVASPGEGARKGVVYLFEKDAGLWDTVAEIREPAGRSSGDFAASLALDGDRLLIGSPTESNSSGAALLYRRDSRGLWKLEARLDPSFGSRDAAGTSVGLSGDYAFVGAPRADRGCGNVTVWRNDDVLGTWKLVDVLTPDSEIDVHAENVGFGQSLSVDGGELWVGAPGLAFAGALPETGGAFRFQRHMERWSAREVWQPAVPIPESKYGTFLAVAGDEVALGGATRFEVCSLPVDEGGMSANPASLPALEGESFSLYLDLGSRFAGAPYRILSMEGAEPAFDADGLMGILDTHGRAQARLQLRDPRALSTKLLSFRGVARESGGQVWLTPPVPVSVHSPSLGGVVAQIIEPEGSVAPVFEGPDCDSAVPSDPEDAFVFFEAMETGSDQTIYLWDFGDGNSGLGRNVSHTYAAAGTYEVTLSVEDPSTAASDSEARSIRLNYRPTQCFQLLDAASMDPISTPSLNQMVILDASGSYDLDGDVDRYLWWIEVCKEPTNTPVIPARECIELPQDAGDLLDGFGPNFVMTDPTFPFIFGPKFEGSTVQVRLVVIDDDDDTGGNASGNGSPYEF